MSSVSSSSALGGSVDLDVVQHQLVDIDAVLDLGVGNEVGQQVQDNLHGLLWPSTLGDSEFLGLGGSTSGSSVSGVWDASLVLKHLVEVLLSDNHVHSSEGSAHIVGVLEVGSDVVSTGLGGWGQKRAYSCLGSLVLWQTS